VAKRRKEAVLVDPKVTVSTEVTNKASGTITTAQYQIPLEDIPYMDEIKKLIGDGLAKVTVSADFGIKDFGTGASAMCSVSLTCDQSAQVIEEAARIAGEMARDIAQEQRARAEQELEAIVTGRQGR
jgi:hypothetical protein